MCVPFRLSTEWVVDFPRLRRGLGLVAIALLTMTAAANLAAAQSRDPQAGGPSPAGTTTPDPANDPRDDADGRPGGGGTAGLPDAGTVLDILRLWPGFPGRPTGIDDGVAVPPPVIATPPDGRAPNKPPGPPRVTRIVPGIPVTPRPQPRGDNQPPVVIGDASPDIRANEVLVALTPGSTAATVFALARDFALDGDTVYQSDVLGARLVRFRILDQRTPDEVVAALAGDARVRVAQPNYVYAAIGAGAGAAPANLPQYAPDKLRLKEAHDVAKGKTVTVAVIDTAVDSAHPALSGAVSAAFDALGEGEGKSEFHGTAIASIVAARRALTGVAPAADVLAIRAFADDNGTSRSHSLAILKALDFAVRRGARVINMSFAGPRDALLEEAIAVSIKNGAVIVAAAGNGGPDAPPAYPAAFPDVIAVSATGPDDAVFRAANQGDYIAVAAPGVDIVAAAPGGAYDITSGTSMAAAHISGIAALLLEADPGLAPSDVRRRLTETARRGGQDENRIGAGIADAAAALRAD